MKIDSTVLSLFSAPAPFPGWEKAKNDAEYTQFIIISIVFIAVMFHM